MGIKVNPPLQERIPKKLAEDPETKRWLEYLIDIIEKLRLRTGGGSDSVETGNQFVTTNQAGLNAISQRLGSGDALTSDETGFTVDSINLSVDMTEAILSAVMIET